MFFLFKLSCFYTYSQELQWTKKNDLIDCLYKSFENFVDENSYDSKSSCNPLFVFFKTRMINKNLTKQNQRNEIKKLLENHFISQDTISDFFIFNKDQLVKSKKDVSDFSIVRWEEFKIKEKNFFILMIDHCFGLRCLSIYIFELDGKNWKLISGEKPT